MGERCEQGMREVRCRVGMGSALVQSVCDHVLESVIIVRLKFVSSAPLLQPTHPASPSSLW